MNQGRIVAAGLLATFLSGCAEAVVSGTPEIEEAPPRLELRLSAKDTTPAFNLAGLSEQQFKDKLREKPFAAQLPAPDVKLALDIVNRSAGEITFDTGPGWYTLDLQGPGVEQTSTPSMWCIPPPPVTLASGKSHAAAINGISYFETKSSKRFFWTKPGKYTLTAKARLSVDGKTFTLQSNSVTFDVAKRPAHKGPDVQPALQAPEAAGYIQLRPE